uniref:RBR-type E3 ubiquitin transferase n=1 Tax=Haplochromis burtoni TaxID=8153 RepID=A0A3Q2VZP3_HAPBU
MSCGHAVTPTSLTNWCRRLLDQCPGCGFAVTRENGSDLNVLCKVCTAVAGRPFEFCWQCLREWKGARPRKDRCDNGGCCNTSLETLEKCPDITLFRVCPSVRACPTCGLLLEHSKKYCPSVVCPRCSGTFCFVCLKHSGKCQMTRCIPAPRQTSIPVGQHLCLLLKPEKDNRWDPNEQSSDISRKTEPLNLSKDDVVSL